MLVQNKIRIGSKPVAPGPGQMKIRYDLGKYKRSLVGEVVDACDGTVAIWCYRGKDSDGPYYALMCVTRR